MSTSLMRKVFKLQYKAGLDKEPVMNSLFAMIDEELNRGDISGQVQYDDAGNIYVTKGQAESYPCVVAHYDQVHIPVDSFCLKRHDDILYAINGDTGEQVGVGGDDKSGIYVLLMALRKVDAVKAVVFADEEVGMVGSRECDIGFFDDTHVVIEVDRNGGGDACTFTNGVDVASEEYIIDALDILNDHGYKPTQGMATDIGELRIMGMKTPSMNLSGGYYRPHTGTEIVLVSELMNARDLTIRLLTEVPRSEAHFLDEYVDDFYGSMVRCPACGGNYAEIYHGEIFCYDCGALTVVGKKGSCADCGEEALYDAIEDAYYCISCSIYLEEEE